MSDNLVQQYGDALKRYSSSKDALNRFKTLMHKLAGLEWEYFRTDVDQLYVFARLGASPETINPGEWPDGKKVREAVNEHIEARESARNLYARLPADLKATVKEPPA